MTTISNPTPVQGTGINVPVTELMDPNYETGSGGKPSDHPSVEVTDVVSLNGLVTLKTVSE